MSISNLITTKVFYKKLMYRRLVKLIRVSFNMSSRAKRADRKQNQAVTEEKSGSVPKPKKQVKKEGMDDLQDIANLLRIDSINITNITKTGHPTSCASIAEVMASLFFHENGLHFFPDKPDNFLNDRFILSKGHAAPILYACLARSGVIPKEELLIVRKKDALLQGHPVPSIPFVDVATGSLGMGLSFSAGIAYSSMYYDKLDNKVFCVMGDGESAEGSIWEAAAFASYYKLNNIIAILDINKLGQSDPTMYNDQIKVYEKRFQAFGWNAIKVDGNNIEAMVKALKTARDSKLPAIILADTSKGKGFEKKIESSMGWHGKALAAESDQTIKLIQSLILNKEIVLSPNHPEGVQPEMEDKKVQIVISNPDRKPISTRKAYGYALVKAYESNNNVVALDADTKNSTFSCFLRQKHHSAHIECFIAEQNMVGVGIGISTRRKIPFISTFGCFFSRAADQIRIAGLSQSNIKMVGSHSGVSIGEDGPSQMALEDIAFMRTIPNLVLFYPSDGVTTEKAVEMAANYKGPVYIRTSRPDLALLYPDNQTFEIGKCKVLRQSDTDKLVIVSAGVTLHEAIEAAKKLQQQNIHVRVIDLFTLKPVDVEGLVKNANEAGKLVLTVEEHYKEGGIYDLVASALSIDKIPVHGLYVSKIPGSAKPEEQLEIHGIDAASIRIKVKTILGL